MKLQELENNFEDSAAALKAAEDSMKTGLDSSHGTDFSSDSINISTSYQQPSLFAGNAGLSALTNEANWLRIALAGSGGMHLGGLGLGMGGQNPMARFNSSLFHGYGVSADNQAAAMNAAALWNMVNLSNGLPGGIDSIGDANLLKSSLSDAALALYFPRALSSVPYSSLEVPGALSAQQEVLQHHLATAATSASQQSLAPSWTCRWS